MTPSFTSKARLLLISTVTVAFAALTGCNRDREDAGTPRPTATASATVTTRDAAAPMGFESKSPWAEVKLTLPEAIKPQTDLHARLYAEEVRRLRQFSEGAQGERTEAGNDVTMPPYAKDIAITAAAETAKLLSLKRVDYDFSGGAHPNTLMAGLLWDKAMKRQIGLTDLLQKSADFSVLDQALCSAVNAAKRVRVPDSSGITLDGKDWSCPRVRDTAFVLTPGSVSGKAAGLTFLIGPYLVGPYAEGAYEIALPLTVFRSMLAPAYLGEFGGQLAKAGDLTPIAAPLPAAAAVGSAR
ncbi:DUF3298 domain-containing protein [Brevundimonas sp.]|uniref:DUF3298 and DUF4163 domain-containing protein n=1 Tax=Brevundimonas sp. TaxID=1871086 RepID=UPI00356713A4